MTLHNRLTKLENKISPDEIKIIVTKSETAGGCPSPSERAANPELNKIIYVCHCPNCQPEFYKRKADEKNKNV